jgi:hypothetical protein
MELLLSVLKIDCFDAIIDVPIYLLQAYYLPNYKEQHTMGGQEVQDLRTQQRG